MTQSMDFLAKFIQTHPIPPETYQHFSSIPWTNSYLQDPAYKAVPTYSRSLKPDGEDYFFARTINTPITIPHLISLQLKNLTLPPPTPTNISIKNLTHLEEFTIPDKPDTIHLLQLGRQGLDGHTGLIHGGVASAILDEMMATCVMLHRKASTDARQFLFTANLDVNFRRPVPTNEIVFVRCWLAATQGRRWYTFGQIVSKDGTVLTEAQAVWVHTSSREKL